jgi:hypothetical protein
MNHEKTAQPIWTGLVESIPEVGCELLDLGNGAFVRIFAWSESQPQYEERARELMTHYKLRVLSFDQVEKIKNGELYGETPARLKEILTQARAAKGVIFGTFYSYPLHDGKKM